MAQTSATLQALEKHLRNCIGGGWSAGLASQDGEDVRLLRVEAHELEGASLVFAERPFPLVRLASQVAGAFTGFAAISLFRLEVLMPLREATQEERLALFTATVMGTPLSTLRELRFLDRHVWERKEGDHETIQHVVGDAAPDRVRHVGRLTEGGGAGDRGAFRGRGGAGSGR